MIQEVTRPRVTQNSRSLIDHIYVSNETAIKESGCLDADHYMVYVVRMGSGSQCKGHNVSRVRALRRCNVSLLQHDLR